MHINPLSSENFVETSKTKLTTVRIPRALYKVIQEDAESDGVGFNTVLTRILRKYVEWDRVAEKLGMLSVTREAMKSLMGAISESQIDTIAKKDAPPVTKEMAEFWFMSSSIESQIQLLERFCKYGGLGDYNINKVENETKLHLRHGLGRSFSRMLAGIFGTIFQSVNPQVEAEENSITIVLRNRVKRKK